MTNPTPTVVNLTSELKAAAAIPAMLRGLYVQFFDNMSEQAVYDRSGGPEGGGKLLIKPRGRTLAFGSFVDGLLAHRDEEAAQMHRRPTVGSINPYSKEFRFAADSGTYAECLRLFVVLDLGSASVEAVESAEDALRGALEAFLRKEGRLVLDRSGGYCRYDEEEVDEEFVGRLEAWAGEVLVGLG